MLKIDGLEKKIVVSFDSDSVHQRHEAWLDEVGARVGDLGELNPQPYWGFADVYHKAGTKLLNTFYVVADCEKDSKGIEYYNYNQIYKLTNFTLDGWLDAIEEGVLFVDFDARTGHNHGTKFRLKQNELPRLYGSIEKI